MPRVNEILYPGPRSCLPPGGCPDDDRAYLAWRDEFLCLAAERDLARRWHETADLPLTREAWALDAYLYSTLGGPSPTIYSHRLRFLGVALHLRRRAVLRAATAFVEKGSPR